MIDFHYLLHLFEVLPRSFYTPLHPLEPLLETATPLVLRHCTQLLIVGSNSIFWPGKSVSAYAILHVREQEKVARGQVGTVGWMSHLISPASFPETQLLHWLCGKRHCHGGAEFLAVLFLAASPEFFRILGGAKLLYTISL